MLCSVIFFSVLGRNRRRTVVATDERTDIMKLRKLGLSLTALVAAVALSACEPPETVDYVEIDRYLGTWYEIASYPAFFQRQCIGDTTAHYEPHPTRPGQISVTNRCRTGPGDNDWDEARGRARIVDRETNAKLKVYFSIFPGNYWVIDLDDAPGDEPYRYAVVGESSRKYLWILSRTPTLDDETLDRILDGLVDQGYDTDKLRWTPQSGQ